MRKSKEETAESRRRILDAAARLYREKGFDGVGVADIMEAAGMTHGGFYRHFPSKEALIGEAMSDTFTAWAARLTPADDAAGLELLREYARMYLSEGHLDTPSGGCPVAAVGSEAGHVGGVVSSAFNDGIEQLVQRVASALGDSKEDRAQALRLLSTMVGAVIVARAAGPGSRIRSEVLEAVRKDNEVARLVAPEPYSSVRGQP
jgi:TetR/AcrR family transcriptional repressor of nem operon